MYSYWLYKSTYFKIVERIIDVGKIIKAGFWVFITFGLFGIITLFEVREWPVGSAIAGLLAGFTLPNINTSIQDIFDDSNWKESQRKYERGKLIRKEDKIRLSFAYLFRIKIDNEYLLVKNERGTGKYQPVGGVYKMKPEEAIVLRQKFSASDDDKIPIDESSKGDYRIWIPDKYLRKFVQRFDRTKGREQLENLSREFKEELIDTGLLHFEQLKYRYCGRHFEKIRFSQHFQCYELLMADIIDVELDSVQENELRRLKNISSEQYLFATAEQINSLGIKAGTNKLQEIIGDHTTKILQENAHNLIKTSDCKKVFKVNL